MKIMLAPDAWQQMLHWRDADPAIAGKIDRLIEECRRSPFTGTGKPEPLRGEASGWRSRRIND